MSLRYKVLERCIKAVDIKRIYSMSEKDLFEYLETKHRAYDVPDFLYKKLNVEKTEINGRLLFKIHDDNRKTSKVILFIHGGGGMMCPTLLHYRFAEKLVKNTGATLYFPFYPLGPEAKISESMMFIDEVYKEILKKHKAEDITVIGDSAGAALTVSACRRAEEKPNGAVLISPSVGIDRSDGKMKELEDKDVILSQRTIELVKKHWIGDISVKEADFNTLKPDYKNFPSVQLYYGTNEIFYPYIGELVQAIKNSGTEICAFEGQGLCHDWVLIGILPESREAFSRICRFVTE